MTEAQVALVARLRFILTFVTAIPAALLCDPVRDDTRHVAAGIMKRVLVRAGP